MARRKNYLSNENLLEQVHLSKMSYCKFTDYETDNKQDYILDDISEIFETQNVVIGKDENKEEIFGDVPVIDLARLSRLKRLNKYRDEKLTIDDILVTDVVFRIMTNEHIPKVPKKKAKRIEQQKKKKQIITELFTEFNEEGEEIIPEIQLEEDLVMIPIRCKFNAFWHYRLDEENNPVLIGKSHWKGKSIHDGEFCMTHGHTTDELGRMYLKLVERYATRSNWRGYTYNEEMRGAALLQLSAVGLQFNEAKSLNPFSYLTQITTNSFTSVLNTEKKMQGIRDDILEANGLNPSWSRQTKNDDAIEANKKERENNETADS